MNYGEGKTGVKNNETKGVDSALDFLLAPKQSIIPLPGSLRAQSRLRFFLHFGWIFFVALSILYVLWWRAPREFPAGMHITVERGTTLNETTVFLTGKDVIRSPFWFKAWSVILGGSRGVKAGTYYFSAPLSVIPLAWRMTRGAEYRETIRVTVPEGLSNAKVATLLQNILPGFDSARFERIAAKKEGYLFPDTYFFKVGSSAEEIITEMEQNFAEQVRPLQSTLRDFGRPLRDVIIMASLIEGEVRTAEARRQVSGILWKRLELGMPLQVDAVFAYIIGRNTVAVTTDDLKIDSPYNTYRFAGLPPGPINNPGLDAITAAITPTSSNFLYYLTDSEGQIHYATTHAEHLVNRAKYLGK